MLAKPQKKKIMKLPPFQFENDNSWPPKPGRKKEINTDRPPVQIKAERKLDFFFPVVRFIFHSGLFINTVSAAGYKTVMLQHKIGHESAGRSLSRTFLVPPSL